MFVLKIEWKFKEMRKNLKNTIFSTTNPTLYGLKSDRTICGERPVIKHWIITRLQVEKGNCFFINMVCVTLRKFYGVEITVNDILFVATSFHVLSRNHKIISVKTGLVENFLGGTAGKIFVVRCKQNNVGCSFWFVVLKNCMGYYK